MAKIRGKLFLALTLMLVLIVFGGCAVQRKPLPPEPDAPDRVPEMEVKPAPDRSPAEDRDIAADINRIAESVPGVARSYSVVIGNAVLIGLDIDKDQQEQGISKIKNRVAEKAEADSRIVRAYVSSDPDTTARIRELADNIRNGRPVTEYLDEIGEIIQRLTPQTD
ncbi:YhcN/YlaJ family sporulation lipoprotein [Phosphitispora fastidiosa]|uniref:YhcN/YlaJ family sporulation lipoprotein n=1 Tax=Phosphitispora fastidiosa TaxID=2837202 RepID=UPI001E409B8D|nr:YhcN/YlaJ family sporulation lipoprotein [Phosphitispora fastidiosa]MBU7006257.1 YhcN/YlaJ family sporulation lipoprotein [Phosphitispora fastidiosa]